LRILSSIPITMAPTDIVRRVVSRFAAARHGSAAVEIRPDGGVVTTGDLRRGLEPRLGRRLFNMRLRPSLVGSPNTIPWEALDETAAVGAGTATIHAAVGTTEIHLWVDVAVDELEGHVRFAAAGGSEQVVTADAVAPRRVLDDRLRQVAQQLRR